MIMKRWECKCGNMIYYDEVNNSIYHDVPVCEAFTEKMSQVGAKYIGRHAATTVEIDEACTDLDN